MTLSAHRQVGERASSRGFSLVEMLTVVAIVGILLGIGVPSFRYITTANRTTSVINNLLGDMQFARAEAIKEGQPVTVCASADQATCSGAVAWTTGWIVFSDNTPALQQVNGNDFVLRTQRRLNGGDTLVSSAPAAITFNREGFAFGLPGTVSFTVSDSTGSATYKRRLCVSIVGSLSTLPNAGACP